MKQVTRENVLEALQQEWGTYIDRFHTLTAGEQQLFLDKQGYKNLTDLLAHVIVWWQDAMPNIIRYLEDPDAAPADYDIDAFNARAVERFQGAGEADVVHLFENTRDELIGLVESIPEWAFSDKNAARRLYAETIGHYLEHTFEA